MSWRDWAWDTATLVALYWLCILGGMWVVTQVRQYRDMKAGERAYRRQRQLEADLQAMVVQALDADRDDRLAADRIAIERLLASVKEVK